MEFFARRKGQACAADRCLQRGRPGCCAAYTQNGQKCKNCAIGIRAGNYVCGVHLKAKNVYTAANDVRKPRKSRAAPRKSRAAPRKSPKSNNKRRRTELIDKLVDNPRLVDYINELIIGDDANESDGHGRMYGTRPGDDVESYLHNAPLSTLDSLAAEFKDDSDDDDTDN